MESKNIKLLKEIVKNKENNINLKLFEKPYIKKHTPKVFGMDITKRVIMLYNELK